MSKYNSNLWENDASLVPMTPERKKIIDEGTFYFLNQMGMTPEQAFPNDKARQDAYKAWVEANPTEA